MCADCKSTFLVPKRWWVAVAVHGVHKVREMDAIEGGDKSVQRVGVAEVDIGRTETAGGNKEECQGLHRGCRDDIFVGLEIAE